ncbi:cytochrome c oxidase subunit 3 family protein [Salisaeta longa]|uniref:cytochrome c oxidase subunit 3 family protein n=1 Tax=Salisaeta longa TaxID=503170 RepID=UPI0003B48837|nr:cytochrome c oxidase subunit 3 family protein [Salisaeta longa]
MATETAPATTSAGDVHAHQHPPHLEHHFVSSEQQFDSAKLGMWIFLATEILLFSGMFVAYAVFRQWHPDAFLAASNALNWVMGGTNTVVLLTSSLTVALSIHFAQKEEQRKMVWSLLATLVLAGVFLVIKYFEYTAKFEHGVYPGSFFDPHGAHYAYLADIPFAAQFFSIYFVMTGIHGVHVLIGMALIGWIAWRANRGDFSSEWYTPVELTGLYWHLVDIIWIFLFPLLYLI